jgi:uncharacterized membrane protein
MLDLLTKFFTGDAGQKRLMVIIIVFMALQFIATMTGHQQLESYNHALTIAEQTVQRCTSGL